MTLGGPKASTADETASFDSLSKNTSPTVMFTPRGWYSPGPSLGLRRAPVSRTCSLTQTQTRALPAAAVVMVLSPYCGWLWCCYYCCLALSSLVTCNEKTKERKKKEDIKGKHEKRVLVDATKKAYSAQLYSNGWKNEATTKQKNREKTKRSQKAKEAKNFGRVLQQIISSSAITG